MRRAVLGFVLVVVTAAAAGCSMPVPGAPVPAATPTAAPRTLVPPTPAPATAAFADSRGRFRIVPPAGWTTDTSGAQNTTVVFVDPKPTQSEDGPFSANINVLVVSSALGLDATVTRAKQELHGLGAYTSTVDEAVVLADGTPAHLLGGTFTDQRSGFTLQNEQLFVVHAGSTLVATGTALAASWGQSAAAFEGAFGTFAVAAPR
jgi:hypothetical protein